MTHLERLVRAILRSAWSYVRRMSPNYHGNVSSKPHRAKGDELRNCADRLRQAADTLKQSADTLYSADSELTAPEHILPKSRSWYDRRLANLERDQARERAWIKARDMEHQAKRQAREALRQVEKDLEL